MPIRQDVEQTVGVGGDDRLARGQREGLAGHEPDDEAAVEARAGRRGNAGQVLEPDARLIEGGLDQGVQAFDVGAGGDFRHDAAVGAMLVDL